MSAPDAAADKKARPTPTFRPARKADQAEVRALIFSVFDEYEIDPAPKTADRDLDDLEGFYENGFFDLLIAPDGDLMGTVGSAALSANTCELRKMYLKPRYRGRGHGARLLKHAIERARQKGFARMELNTKRVMEEAVGLFAKKGFRPLSGAPLDKRSDQTLSLDL